MTLLPQIKSAIMEDVPAVASMAVGTVCLLIVLLTDVTELLLAVPILLCGLPIMKEAVVEIIEKREISADSLVTVAMIAAVLIGEYFAAAEVALIMSLGEFLEESTINHARSGIRRIVGMVPTSVNRVIGDKVEECRLEDVALGDIVRIRPGESISVDGTVVSGSSYVDRSLLSGEPVPVPVCEGDSVSSGTLNTYGSIDVQVTAVGRDSTIGRIADLLDNADAGKSRIAGLADRSAKYIIAGAFTMAALAYVFTGDIIRSVTVLVVFCPCALVLTTPTAIMAATSNLSKRGILVKDGGALERMAAVDTMLLDKTGTLTTGEISASGFVPADADTDVPAVMRYVASLESRSEHPLGIALSDFCGSASCEVTDFMSRPGYGVSGDVDGRRVCVGNRQLMEQECTGDVSVLTASAEECARNGETVVFASVDGSCMGFFRLSDTVKSGCPAAIGRLNGYGVQTIMLTGDNEHAAKAVSKATGVSDLVWECLPDTKLRVVRNMEDEHRIGMVGDGINDAPSLKRADVGIAMGKEGKSITIEAADIVFLEDDITKLPGLFRLSRRTLTTIKTGMAFSMTVNIVGVILAVAGLMGPIAGALVHNVGSLIVIGASALLIRYDPWKEESAAMNGTAQAC